MSDDEVVEPSIEQLAYAAKELQWFLSHDAVTKAFKATEQRIAKEWERGQNPLEREMAWHKLMAFRALKSELQAMSQRRPELET